MIKLITKYFNYLILIIIGILVSLLIVLNSNSRDVNLTVVWDKIESPEAKEVLSLYQLTKPYLFNIDSAKTGKYIMPISMQQTQTKSRPVGINNINPETTSLKFKFNYYKTDYYFFVMTATDSVGNESSLSNIAVIYLKILTPPKNVRIK